jgi:hypothetical protein
MRNTTTVLACATGGRSVGRLDQAWIYAADGKIVNQDKLDGYFLA